MLVCFSQNQKVGGSFGIRPVGNYKRHWGLIASRSSFLPMLISPHYPPYRPSTSRAPSAPAIRFGMTDTVAITPAVGDIDLGEINAFLDKPLDLDNLPWTLTAAGLKTNRDLFGLIYELSQATRYDEVGPYQGPTVTFEDLRRYIWPFANPFGANSEAAQDAEQQQLLQNIMSRYQVSAKGDVAEYFYRPLSWKQIEPLLQEMKEHQLLAGKFLQYGFTISPKVQALIQEDAFEAPLPERLDTLENWLVENIRSSLVEPILNTPIYADQPFTYGDGLRELDGAIRNPRINPSERDRKTRVLSFSQVENWLHEIKTGPAEARSAIYSLFPALGLIYTGPTQIYLTNSAQEWLKNNPH